MATTTKNKIAGKAKRRTNKKVMEKLNLSVNLYPTITAYRAAFNPATGYGEIEVLVQGNPVRLYQGSSLPTLSVLLTMLSNQNKSLLTNGYVYITG